MASKIIKWLRCIFFRDNIGDEMHEVCTRHPGTKDQYEIKEAYDPFLKRSQFVIREKKRKPYEKETVRIGTCLALRCFECAKKFYDQGWPWWFEQPKRREGFPHLFSLPEAQEIIELFGVEFVAFVQCMLGA